MQYVWNGKKNPRRDVHMYSKKPNVHAKFIFLWLQFLGGVVCFHLEDYQQINNGTIDIWSSNFNFN